MPSHQHNDFILSLHDGGLNGFRGLFDSVCVGSIAKRFSSSVGVSYTTINEFGDEKQKGPKIKIIRPYSITKVSEKRAIGDTDKPSAFEVASGTVGYNIVDKEIKYITRLHRYSGDYNPAVQYTTNINYLIQAQATLQKKKLLFMGSLMDWVLLLSLIKIA